MQVVSTIFVLVMLLIISACWEAYANWGRTASLVTMIVCGILILLVVGANVIDVNSKRLNKKD